MEIFYHIPERRISLVQVQVQVWWATAHSRVYQILRPWDSSLGVTPRSDLGDALTPVFGCQIAVTPMSLWRRVGGHAVALIYIQQFRVEEFA